MSADGNNHTNGNHKPGGAMTSADLADCLDRWGADLTAWPDRELAGSANALIGRDSAARMHWNEARALDALLDAVPTPDVSPGFADRIVAATHNAPPVSNVISLAGVGKQHRVRWSPLALAASLLIGLVIGAGTSPETIDSWLGGTVYAADEFGIGFAESSE